MRSFLLVLAVAACKGQPAGTGSPTGVNPTDPAGTPPPTTVEPCGALLTVSNPNDGATDVAVDAPINIQFNAPITDVDPWRIALTGVTGTATLAADGRSADFVPDAPLEYETTYAIEAEVCEDGGLFTFTTENAPLSDSDIEGKTYAIPYGDVVFTAPPPNLMNQLVASPVDFILMQIVDIDDTTRVFSANAGAAVFVNGIPAVDCAFAFDAGTGLYDNPPFIEVGPTLFQLPIAGQNVAIEDMEIDGSISPDGNAVTDLTITGKFDTRGIDVGGLDVCFLAGLAQVNCVQCADGAPRCLNVNASAPQADWDANLDIAGCFVP